MSVHYELNGVTLHHGDCLDVLASLPDASVDSVVTDPPYGLANTSPEQVADTVRRWSNGERDYMPGGSGFMGKAWDAFVPPVAVWDECLRVLKPGGHLVAFAGSRTFDLMTLSVRLAGFEIRDSLAWCYASGFPKSLDVSKAIDKAAGAEREVVGSKIGLPGYSLTDGNGDHRTYSRGLGNTGNGIGECSITAPATDDARRWEGWGTALKPAFEPIVLARKPLAGTVAANVLTHGTGALNVDGCRIATDDTLTGSGTPPLRHGGDNSRPFHAEAIPRGVNQNPAGRWPANLLLDEHQAAALDEMSGERSSGMMRAGTRPKGERETFGKDAANGYETTADTYGDRGGASRFFFVAKADGSERPRVDGIAHPTVKPLDLMRWLVRLITPPGGVVLEPFAGSGTTIEAAILEGFDVIGIEREADYLPLIESRISRRRDPVRAVELTGDDPGLFDLLDEGGAA